jgi:UDP-N-acetylmuramoylalanine--D-glutamate ligase
MNFDYVKNLKTPIAIIGFGKSGQSAFNLLRAIGFSETQLISYDEKISTAKVHDVPTLLSLQPQTLVVSPGVPLNSAWIVDAKNKDLHITSEINLAASLLSSEKVVGVTGSVGKSTVVSLLGAAVQSFDAHAFVGGNLGIPFCDYALKKISDTQPPAKWIVLELSSYQLENCELLKLEHSIISFLSPNHLERYPSLSDYYMTKMKITAMTRGFCIMNKTSEDCRAYAARSKCKTVLVNADTFTNQGLLHEIFLIGAHNKDNFTLAAELALLSAWPEECLLEMAKYKGLSHRLEFVASLDGVTYINDSKATAMDSVLVAARGCIEGIKAPNKLFLLLGGKDKNLPWHELSVLSASDVINPVFFGACGELARNKSQLTGEYFEKLGSAINFCQKRAHSGDVVLLSPGGTSLDEFKNFEERGDFFKTLILSQIDA